MTYAPDPGGNFASDAHRRIMAHLPNPDDAPITIGELILDRVNHDPHTLKHFTTANEIEQILSELEADGYAKNLKAGWANTKTGFDLLTGPPSETATVTTPTMIRLSPNGDA